MRTGTRCASRTQLMVGTTSGRSSPPALIAAVKVDIKSDEVKHDIIESMLEIATGGYSDEPAGAVNQLLNRQNDVNLITDQLFITSTIMIYLIKL